MDKNKIAAPAPTVPLMLRLPADLHEWIKERAKAETRSLNSQVVVILKEAKQRDEQRIPDAS